MTASNQSGSALQSSAAFTVNAAGGGAGGGGGGGTGGGGGGGSVQASVARKLRVSPSVFPAAASGPSEIKPNGNQKKHRSNSVATVSYTLSIAAIVRFTVNDVLSGRKQGHGKTARCVAPTHRNRNARRCKRVVTLRGSFSQTGKPGANSLRFSGRL